MPSKSRPDETEFVKSFNRKNFDAIDGMTLAWLIETKSDSLYELRKGKQLIGRHSSSKHSDIRVHTDDLQMSGAHCFIDIDLTPKGYLEFLISDNNSRNGVNINHNKKLYPGEVLHLKDGYVISLGHSDLFFVSVESVKSADQALQYYRARKSR